MRDLTPKVTEPWLDKGGLAEHLACSVRTIQYWLAEGMPHAELLGRNRFRVSEVEPWLEARGYLVRCGAEADNVRADIERAGDADTPRPRTPGGSPDAS